MSALQTTLHEVISQMRLRGGSFVQALAEAMFVADGENMGRILAAFPEIIERYDAMALTDREDDDETPAEDIAAAREDEISERGDREFKLAQEENA